MQNDKQIIISQAGSRRATFWPSSTLMWSEFADRLRTPAKSTETIEEYLAYPKSKQDELKDVGGYVGGTLAGNRRKANNVTGRDLLTLDLDNIPAGKSPDIIKKVKTLGCGSVVYSTRKHTDYAPRLRVIVPLDRTASADEYEPAARKIASLLGMEYCDPTTFEACRLMYWPSASSNSNYVCEITDAPFCSLDGLLGAYNDWHDVNEWPTVPGAEHIERRNLSKQEDPTAKKGLIGAFCRTYTLTAAMDRFLPGIYEETDVPGRYTYLGGSTVGGAVVYDGDLFLYSHHATDPCSGQLVNAFDMVRLHKYGSQDDEAKPGTPNNKLPSFASMSRLVMEDKDVTALLAQERREETVAVFGADTEGEPDDDLAWAHTLTYGGDGKPEKTINNVVIILEHDQLLKGHIVVDEFANCGLKVGPLPWDPDNQKARWQDSDDANFYRYMEVAYGITGREKLDMGLLIVSAKNSINDVRDYLLGLSWDGVARLDTMLVDYLGADDSVYTRAVARKTLCAAVARAFEGGVKFDNMPILTGPQGVGKSTFLAYLGKDWFSDSLTTFEGKEAAELIQGTWINEIGELTAMTKQENNAVKQFLSKTHDIYRAAYGRRTNKYPRRCVFIGTSNNHEFLKDSTGGRRFWPIDVGKRTPVKSVWHQLPAEVDQIWAEAVVRFRLGEVLYLSGEADKIAKEQQEYHREGSSKEGLILDFLERQIPDTWNKMSVAQRKMYLCGQMRQDDEIILERRTRVCAAELWVECLGADLRYMKRSDSAELMAIMDALPGWRRIHSTARFGPYGVQKGFEIVN